jgi:SAM-dependent methyltransferase
MITPIRFARQSDDEEKTESNLPTGNSVKHLSQIYSSMVNWPKRLENETPFFRSLVQRASATRLLDVACGTGEHALMFHSWSLDVEAADASPEMVASARQLAGSRAGLRFVERDFVAPIESAQPFDIAICVGNSLALADDEQAAGQAISRMVEAVRPGGLVVVQVLNIYRLAEGPCLWQKCFQARLEGRDVLVTKGVSRCGDRGYVQLLIAELCEPPALQAETTQLLGLSCQSLQSMAQSAGAKDIEFWGDYHQQEFDPNNSVDLIMVAEVAEKD